MNEFEEDLRLLRREAPSPAFDARMEAALAAAERNAAPDSRGHPWLWWSAGGLGLAAAAAIALVMTRPVAPAVHGPDATVYRIETRAPMRALLLEPAHTRPAPPRVFVSVSVSAP